VSREPIGCRTTRSESIRALAMRRVSSERRTPVVHGAEVACGPRWQNREVSQTPSDRHAVDVPVRTELRRLGLIVLVIVAVGTTVLTAVVATLSAAEQRVTAVPGWGHCIIKCSGIPLSTVEDLSGVTVPRNSTVLEINGAHGGIGRSWAEAYIRTPRAHQLATAPASTVRGCLQPSVNQLNKWGVRHEYAGGVDGRCVQYGVTRSGDQVVHIVGYGDDR
jgi:hypothetical protein